MAVTPGPDTASHERCFRAYGDGEALEMVHYARVCDEIDEIDEFDHMFHHYW